jgi:hypothetical protein
MNKVSFFLFLGLFCFFSTLRAQTKLSFGLRASGGFGYNPNLFQADSGSILLTPRIRSGFGQQLVRLTNSYGISARYRINPSWAVQLGGDWNNVVYHADPTPPIINPNGQGTTYMMWTYFYGITADAQYFYNMNKNQFVRMGFKTTRGYFQNEYEQATFPDGVVWTDYYSKKVVFMLEPEWGGTVLQTNNMSLDLSVGANINVSGKNLLTSYYERLGNTTKINMNGNRILFNARYYVSFKKPDIQVTKPPKSSRPPKEEVVVKKEPKKEKDKTDKEVVQREVDVQHIFEVPSKKVKIIIYDGMTVDNDIVSLYFNGERILHKYAISGKKKVLELELQPGTENILVSFAHNMGKYGKNTATIEIVSGKFTHKVDINSSNNESGAIRFIYNGK